MAVSDGGGIHAVLNFTFWGWLVYELVHAVRTRRNSQPGQDRLSGPLMILSGILGVSISVRIAEARGFAPGVHIQYAAIGLAVMWCGISLRAWAFSTLGTLFTYRVTIQASHHVVTSGPYRFVRHPSYTGLGLFFIGYVLAFANALALLILLAFWVPALSYRIVIEERTLKAAFGDEYRTYARRTKRLIPGII